MREKHQKMLSVAHNVTKTVGETSVSRHRVTEQKLAGLAKLVVTHLFVISPPPPHQVVTVMEGNCKSEGDVYAVLTR